MKSRRFDSAIQCVVETEYALHCFVLDDWDGRLVHATTYHCKWCGLSEDEHGATVDKLARKGDTLGHSHS